jgi:hypothetical protein
MTCPDEIAGRRITRKEETFTANDSKLEVFICQILK